MKLAFCLAVAVLCGCSPAPEPPPRSIAADAPRAEPLRFAFVTLDGRPVTAATYHGRMTVVALVATYDSASQAQALFVETAFRKHTPRINALMLVLEPESNRTLVETFVEVLALHYDVAFADADTIAGEGPFRGLHHVPSIVLLDKNGREVWRNLGVIDDRALGEAITAHE
jgi:hypothetical protein